MASSDDVSLSSTVVAGGEEKVVVDTDDLHRTWKQTLLTRLLDAAKQVDCLNSAPLFLVDFCNNFLFVEIVFSARRISAVAKSSLATRTHALLACWLNGKQCSITA